MKECLRKGGLDVRQATRMVQDRSEWRRFVWGNAIGRNPEDEPLTLTSCHSYMKPLEGGIPSVAEPTTVRA